MGSTSSGLRRMKRGRKTLVRLVPFEQAVSMHEELYEMSNRVDDMMPDVEQFMGRKSLPYSHLTTIRRLLMNASGEIYSLKQEKQHA